MGESFLGLVLLSASTLLCQSLINVFMMFLLAVLFYSCIIVLEVIKVSQINIYFALPYYYSTLDNFYLIHKWSRVIALSVKNHLLP